MTGASMATEAGAMAVSLAECKAYLRLERDDEDAVITGLVRTAISLCEAFTGQWLVIREGEQRLAVDASWQRISATPVVAVTGVTGAAGPLPGAAFESDIDTASDGWVRLYEPGSAPVVRLRAGMGVDWNGVPEPLRQGLIRLMVHLFTHRDAADAGAPPAAVAALWRPYRRLRLK